MSRMSLLYHKEVTKKLMEKHHYKNVHQVPKIEKVVVNTGVGRAIQNPKSIEEAQAGILKITGQAPIVTKAKKSIAGFKLREKMSIGVTVTLRGERMYEFLDRLISTALPRVRDFRGISEKAFDGHGNYSLGVREHGVFPEISFEEASAPLGLQINIQTSAKNDQEAKDLLKELGFPFRS